MNTSITVMIVEDNAEYRSAVALALDSVPDLVLSSQFGTAEIAIRTLGKLSENARPNVILLDIRLPGQTGLESIPQIRALSPESKIIVLTQSSQEEDVLCAISSGASGYLLKSMTLSELVHGIREVNDGKATLDAGVAKFMLDKLHDQLSKGPVESPITDREMEVLSSIAEGLVKKEIAKRLKIGYATVDTYVTRIYTKLKVNNAPAAVNKAHRMNLFPPDEK